MATTFATIDGHDIAYALLGPSTGIPVVLTPGGRTSMSTPGLRPLGDALAGLGYRVLLWDRPNTGQSSVWFGGRSESHLRADVLAQLLTTLDVGPAVVAGGSGGARDSAVFAMQYPALTSHLMMWNIVGGVFAPMNLASIYVIPSLQAVRRDGIRGLLAMREWQERIEANPSNQAILEALDPGAFVELMLRWLDAFVPKIGQTIPGVDDRDLESITAPTLVVRGGENDLDHPKRTSFEVHSLIRGSIVVDPPWDEDAWERALAGEYPLFHPWPLAATLLDDFVQGRGPRPAALAPHTSGWEARGRRYSPPDDFERPATSQSPTTVW